METVTVRVDGRLSEEARPSVHVNRNNGIIKKSAGSVKQASSSSAKQTHLPKLTGIPPAIWRGEFFELNRVMKTGAAKALGRSSCLLIVPTQGNRACHEAINPRRRLALPLLTKGTPALSSVDLARRFNPRTISRSSISLRDIPLLSAALLLSISFCEIGTPGGSFLLRSPRWSPGPGSRRSEPSTWAAPMPGLNLPTCTG